MPVTVTHNICMSCCWPQIHVFYLHTQYAFCILHSRTPILISIPQPHGLTWAGTIRLYTQTDRCTAQLCRPQYITVSYRPQYITVSYRPQYITYREALKYNLMHETTGLYFRVWPNTTYRLLNKSANVSVSWNQHDAHFIQFIENQGPLCVSSITCSSSGGTTQTAFGIVCVICCECIYC
jgi:hypothetical protein